MDNILEFKKQSEKSVTPLANNKNLVVGNWKFTCVHCEQTHYIECPTMIFKILEFFCRCGRYHKVTNPAFSNSNK